MSFARVNGSSVKFQKLCSVCLMAHRKSSIKLCKLVYLDAARTTSRTQFIKNLLYLFE